MWGKHTNSKGIYIKSFDFLCNPIDQGGLGFKEANKVNQAMISRIVWRLVSHPDDLWAQILKGKYFKKSGALHSKKKSQSSWIWKCILQGIAHIKQYSIWEVGNGTMINIWDDKWLPARAQTLAESFPTRNTSITLVSELIDSNTHKWNIDLLTSLFDNSTVQEITNIRLYTTNEGGLKRDKLRWTLTKNGEYSVKSLYAKLSNPSNSIPVKTKKNWKGLWAMDTSQRIKLFIWKCIQDALPTRLKVRYAENKSVCSVIMLLNLLAIFSLIVIMQKLSGIYSQWPIREYLKL